MGSRPYPGDATRLPDTAYAPQLDGDPDPGEIVWAWVPYEEDHTVGKDRPLLVVGHEGDWLVAMSLTSRDHDRDEHQERAAGPARPAERGARQPPGAPRSEIRPP